MIIIIVTFYGESFNPLPNSHILCFAVKQHMNWRLKSIFCRFILSKTTRRFNQSYSTCFRPSLNPKQARTEKTGGTTERIGETGGTKISSIISISLLFGFITMLRVVVVFFVSPVFFLLWFAPKWVNAFSLFVPTSVEGPDRGSPRSDTTRSGRGFGFRCVFLIIPAVTNTIRAYCMCVCVYFYLCVMNSCSTSSNGVESCSPVGFPLWR